MKINGIEDKMEISLSPRDILAFGCFVLAMILAYNKVSFWWIPLIVTFVASIFSIELKKI